MTIDPRQLISNILKGAEAEIRATPNFSKSVNQLSRAAKQVGGVAHQTDQPSIAVGVPPERYWNSADGPMPVTVLMETPNFEVDKSFNGEVYLLCETLSTPETARIPLSEGQWRGSLNLGPNDGEFQIFAYAPDNGAMGSSVTFQWVA